MATRPDPGASIGGLLLAALLLLATTTALAEENVLLLEVIINGRSTDKIGKFDDRQGALYAAPQELRDIGFRLPKTAPDPIALNQLSGVTYRIDMPTQRLLVMAPAESLMPTLIGQSSGNLVSAVPVQSATGATLNYNFVGTVQAGHPIVSDLVDGRVFTPYGVASSAAVATIGDTANQTIRLDSTYTYSDPDTLSRYRIGDVISGGLSWTRPVRLGGVQMSTDFTIRPDLVTFPVPGLSGQVAVPSTVDVLVNGVQQFSRDVPPGPFQVQQLPIVTGAGIVSAVVTNAQGQQTTQTLPFYASTQLLAPGLDSFSLEAGAVRRNFGLLSDDYADPAGAVSYRHGLSSWLTLEGHAEAAPSLAMGGGGAVVDVAHLGVASLFAAGSTSSGRSGGQFGGGIERITSIVSFSASTLIASRDFQDIAAASGDPVPRSLSRMSTGVSLGGLGSLGLAYTDIRSDAAPPRFFNPVPLFGTLASSPIIDEPVPAQHVQLIT
ncbi:MAG: fimbria/pilus outer membrane usher protein, partial [Aliidongia sp.]